MGATKKLDEIESMFVRGLESNVNIVYIAVSCLWMKLKEIDKVPDDFVDDSKSKVVSHADRTCVYITAI